MASPSGWPSLKQQRKGSNAADSFADGRFLKIIHGQCRDLLSSLQLPCDPEVFARDISAFCQSLGLGSSGKQKGMIQSWYAQLQRAVHSSDRAHGYHGDFGRSETSIPDCLGNLHRVK